MELRRSQKEILADYYSKHCKIVDAKEDLFNIISMYGEIQYHIYMVTVKYAVRVLKYTNKSFVGEIILEPLINWEIKKDYKRNEKT